MSSFKVEVVNLPNVQKQLATISDKVEKEIKKELIAFGDDTVRDAITNIKRPYPLGATDRSHVAGSISKNITDNGLTVEIVVNSDYAAYIEFGTRSFADAHVATLPADWKTFAATFRGPGGGSFAELVQRITEWVHRKGLGTGHRGNIGVTGTYSVKTRRRTGSKSLQEQQDKQAAYLIARKIVRKGIPAHPFLYPAVTHNKAELIKKLEALFNK